MGSLLGCQSAHKETEKKQTQREEFIMPTGMKSVYLKEDSDSRLFTYYELNDGTWKCKENYYKYLCTFQGQLPNSKTDVHYVVLTNEEDLDFDIVAKSQYSSSTKDQKAMKGSLVVEIY